MNVVELSVKGRRFSASVWEIALGRWEAHSRAGWRECRGPHVATCIGPGSPNQSEMGVNFRAEGSTKQKALAALHDAMVGEVIPPE